MVYLSTPYTHDDPFIRHMRFITACRIASRMFKMGYHVLSPIAHCHPIRELTADMPYDYEFWKSYNRDLIALASCLFIGTIEGWDKSKGVCGEADVAVELNINIYYIDPKTFEITDKNPLISN